MRELKFRIWNGSCFVTIPDTYIKTSDGSLWDYDDDCSDTFPSHQTLWSADGKIQQFTGLKDAKGKEIYEGDIIQLEGSLITYSIEWNKYQWAINAHGALGHDPDWNIQPFNHCVYERAIVVGNIFENSKLLNQ
jgi:uncharacterized phage protein (TIGR01671 family)